MIELLNLLFPALLLSQNNILSAEKNFFAMFYNVENLFDTINNPIKNDDEFTPDSKKHKAMLNIGTRPTVSNSMAKSLEVHILDFEGQLYGEEIEILFAQRIRGEMKFDGVEDLKKALAQDEASTREILAGE